jgi:hypothetical protein
VVGRPATMVAAGGDDARCPEFPDARVRTGDSGGGFVVTRGARPQLGGIVSWVASNGAPCVFTRAFRLREWIADVIGDS